MADYKCYSVAQAVLPSNGWTGRVEDCRSGDVPEHVREQVVKRWNYYRRQVGYTRPLLLDKTLSKRAQAAALIMEAAGRLTHEPTGDWTCYTEEGERYANFNLSISSPDMPATSAIDSFMQDRGHGNEKVIHRLWLLYPEFRYAAVAATARVVVAGWRWDEFEGGGVPDPAVQGGLTFVSWPPKGYVAAPLVYPRWSLHYLAQNAFPRSPEDISQARIIMKRKDDQSEVPLQVVARENQNGSFRTIVWEPAIGKPTAANDIVYTVTLEGLMVGEKEKVIAYEVILVHVEE